jgi:lipoprotein-anchoring transpeptidase ErfK/SrfK
VTVSVASGTLTSVIMTSATGKTIAGEISADGTSWHATHALAYSSTYKITASATGGNDAITKRDLSFSTVTPGNMTMPYMDRIGGYGLYTGDTYGVAIVPVVHFDEQIPNEVAAQKALKVIATPAVPGAWYWLDDTDVAYRPQHYWASGTKITVEANVFGVDVGDGLYGQANASTSFTVGRRQLTVAYDNSPKVDKVYVYNAAGKVLRSMDTSMGQHGGETVDGTYINFYTLNGDYTVLDHENPANMSSESYGLPASDPHGYPTIEVPYSTKISTDGIYLHEYNSTIYDQEHGYDVSEGCLNLKTSDAVWFFDHSIPGDPVIVHGAKHAPTIKLDEGGEWSVPWSTWLAGDATA